MSELVSVQDAAKQLGLSRSTIERMVRDGQLAAVRIGARLLLHREDVRALIGEPDESSANRYGRLRGRLLDLLDQAEEATEDAERIRAWLATKGIKSEFRPLRTRVLAGKEVALREVKAEIESVETELAGLLQQDASLPSVFGKDPLQLAELRKTLRAVLGEAEHLRRMMKKPAGLGPGDEMREEKLRQLNDEAARLTKLIRKFEATAEGTADPEP